MNVSTNKGIKALIVYDSLYGNTEKIAKAIGEAFTSSSEVKVLRANEFNQTDLESINLLVVGSPTHGGRPSPATKNFLNSIPANALKDVGVTAFDTRMEIFFTKLFGYAAGRLAKTLQEKGGRLVKPPEGFIVEGGKGPLKQGELERATIWAKEILSVQI